MSLQTIVFTYAAFSADIASHHMIQVVAADVSECSAARGIDMSSRVRGWRSRKSLDSRRKITLDSSYYQLQ